jgi:hypothetical protein
MTMFDMWTPEVMRDVALSVTVVFSMLMIGLRFATKFRKLQVEIVRLVQQSKVAQQQFGALSSGAAAITMHLGRVEQQLRRLAERQDRLDLKDSVTQSYEHAIILIRRGATPEELVLRCGLVRDEAELLVRMYQLDKAG